MIDTLLRALGGAAEAVTNQQSRRRGQDAANAEASKFIHTEAQKAADAGDWQWMYDNEDALTQHIHPHVLDALVSKTKLNNARNYDAQTADGERPVIPLSPKNVLERGQMANINGNIPFYNQTSRPTDATGQAAMPNAVQAVAQVAGNQGPYDGEIGGFAQPGFPTSGGGGQAPDAQTGVSNYQAPGMVGTHPRGIEQDVTPADMSTARQPEVQESLTTGQVDTVKAASTELPTLTIPPDRKPINKSMTVHIAPGNTQTKHTTVTAMTGDELTASLLSQANEKGIPVAEAQRKFHENNVKREAEGKSPLKYDYTAHGHALESEWNTTRANIQQMLVAQGANQHDAFTQSAVMASNKTGFVPAQWMQVVKPTTEQVAAGAFHNVLQQTKARLDSFVSNLKPMLPSAKPSAVLNDLFSEPFLLNAADSIPGVSLDPATRTTVLHSLANTAHNAFLNAVQQSGRPLSPAQQNYFALSMASKAVGGNVPEQWRAFVERDLDKLGLASKDDLAVYQGLPPQLRPDPLDPDFGSRLANTRLALENKKASQQAYRSMAKTPEGLAATEQMFAGKSGVTPSTIGKTERGIEVDQQGAVKQKAADVERANAIIPTAHLEKLQTADGIYKAAREAQQLAQAKDKQGQTILDKYGDTPGSWREFAAKVKGGFGKADPQLTAYLNRLGKVYNYERHTLTGAATSVYEGSALQPYLPAPDDNVRTGLMKLNNLTTQLRDQLDTHLSQAKSDYPRSNHEAFYRNKERTKETEINDLNDIIGEARKRMKKP